ncbi:MAG: FixH family protein [Kiloniellales bacterium]|nr:FixH family protein [Kiloniellales bacterium]
MTGRKGTAMTGSKIPWIFVGFFLTIFLANGIMVTVALSTWTGLETDSAYEDGLAYNDRIAEREAQAALGWQVALALEPAADGRAELRVRLLGPSGEALYADQVQARFKRPTLEGHDFAVTLEDRGAGLYGRQVTLPLPGQWDVELSILKGDDRHSSSRRVMFRP